MGKRTRSIRFSIFYDRKDKKITAKGPIGKFFSENSIKELMKICNAEVGDSFF